MSLFSFHFTIKLESVSFEEICKHNNSLESGHQHRVNRDSDATSCNDLTNTHSYILINITRLISSTRAIEFPERRSIHSFHKLAPIPKADGGDLRRRRAKSKQPHPRNPSSWFLSSTLGLFSLYRTQQVAGINRWPGKNERHNEKKTAACLPADGGILVHD